MVEETAVSRYVWVIEQFIFGYDEWWNLYEIYHSSVRANQKMAELGSDDYRLTKVKLK